MLKINVPTAEKLTHMSSILHIFVACSNSLVICKMTVTKKGRIIKWYPWCGEGTILIPIKNKYVVFWCIPGDIFNIFTPKLHLLLTLWFGSNAMWGTCLLWGTGKGPHLLMPKTSESN